MRKEYGERVIGRLHGALPSEGERYYLYLLLLHEKGSTGFPELKGDHANWRAAAEARGFGLFR